MKLLAALVILSGCGATTTCVTRCGVPVHGAFEPSWSCEAIQRTETLALDTFDKHVIGDARFKRASSCAALSRFQLYLRVERTWNDPVTGAVSGLTYCQPIGSHLVVGTGERTPNTSSLAHEIAHAIQDCDTKAVDKDWPAHEGWQDRLIFESIELVRMTP